MTGHLDISLSRGAIPPWGNSRAHSHLGILLVTVLRGLHSFTLTGGGGLRCIACSCCGGVCPANALSVTLAVTLLVRGRTPGCLSLCYSRCIICSWCDVQCPTSALEQVGTLFVCWVVILELLQCLCRLLGRLSVVVAWDAI